MGRIFALVCVGLPLLSGCTQAPSSELSNAPEIGITHAVLAYYEEYRNQVEPLAFAVSQDGRWATFYYCEARRCVGGGHATPTDVNDAISSCNEVAAEHGPCSLFAMGVGEPRKYHLID